MTQQDKDIMFMERALQLAVNGAGSVAPNPLVGCVIVRNNNIVGEGWHQQYGGDHAEVMAIKNTDPGMLSDATLYVNLEPCSIHGNTPPCADLIIEHPIRRVVVANLDPNPKIAGAGLQRLKNQGLDVSLGTKEQEGAHLNRRFFTYHTKKRPYIILKWAQTKDGFVARENFDSKWISGEKSRKLVHKWRSEEQGILVGAGTVQHDDPHLTVRDWKGKNPTRILLDPHSRLPANHNVFDGAARTIVYSKNKAAEGENLQFIKIESEDYLSGILDDLYQRQLTSIFVEGGSKTLRSFIEADLWDEARVFVSEKSFGSGIDAPRIGLEPFSKETHSEDLLLTYFNH